MVKQGYARSEPPNDNFSEAVLVTFDPTIISMDDLSRIHLQTHSSTSEHAIRSKYRSAVYVFSKEQEQAANAILKNQQDNQSPTVITSVLQLSGFKPSPEKYQNYYEKNADKQFCERHIKPKLEKLNLDFPKFILK